MEKKTAYARTQMDVIVFDKEDVIATSGTANPCQCDGQHHITACVSSDSTSCMNDSPCGMNMIIRAIGQVC